MASRIFALFIWAAVAASLAYWGLRWLAPPTGVPANAASVSLDNTGRGDLRRLLSGPAVASTAPKVTSAASELAGRIKLIGVVAPQGGSGQGVALIAIDGKPPRAVRLGATVDGELVLQALTQRGAEIGPANGAAVVTLDLPLMQPPAVGALPPVAGLERNAAPRVSIDGVSPAPGVAAPAPAARGTLGSPEQQPGGPSQGMPSGQMPPRGQPPA